MTCVCIDLSCEYYIFVELNCHPFIKLHSCTEDEREKVEVVGVASQLEYQSWLGSFRWFTFHAAQPSVEFKSFIYTFPIPTFDFLLSLSLSLQLQLRVAGLTCSVVDFSFYHCRHHHSVTVASAKDILLYTDMVVVLYNVVSNITGAFFFWIFLVWHFFRISPGTNFNFRFWTFKVHDTAFVEEK